MAERERLICKSTDLAEQGHGVRFPMSAPETGFVVRYNGTVHGYVNRCAHLQVPLDWQEGDFFDLTHRYLMCATHGAQYQPETGYCVLGPCKGKSLQKLNVIEQAGNIFLIEES